MRHPEELVARVHHQPVPTRKRTLADDPRAFGARVRAELHRLVRALARRDWETALASIHDPTHEWTPQRFESELQPFFAEHEAIDVTPRARAMHQTRLEKSETGHWTAQQRILATDGDDLWMADCVVDLREERPEGEPLIELRRLGT
jgi:hypothetical protein